MKSEVLDLRTQGRSPYIAQRWATPNVFGGENSTSVGQRPTVLNKTSFSPNLNNKTTSVAQ
ncbi:MAG: hypothetical protein LBU83_03965 [Bacteroidales bacterium]|jgi:hypothetical protein|nr:hypothetical protein [Bacteroidales bacterium]